jgi:hypothetical protein
MLSEEAPVPKENVLEVLYQGGDLFLLNIYEVNPDQADAEGNPSEQRICSVELSRQMLSGFANYCSRMTLST